MTKHYKLNALCLCLKICVMADPTQLSEEDGGYVDKIGSIFSTGTEPTGISS
jgi:hypothetical protein